jgi:hypothetical protein
VGEGSLEVGRGGDRSELAPKTQGRFDCEPFLLCPRGTLRHWRARRALRALVLIAYYFFSQAIPSLSPSSLLLWDIAVR